MLLLKFCRNKVIEILESLANPKIGISCPERCTDSWTDSWTDWWTDTGDIGTGGVGPHTTGNYIQQPGEVQ